MIESLISNGGFGLVISKIRNTFAKLIIINKFTAINGKLYTSCNSIAMAQRPRRSVSRPDYVALSAVKLPRSRKISHDTKTCTEGDSDEFYRLRVVDEDDAMVKVRYIGYSSDFNEWRRKDDIVELSDTSESDGDSRQLSLGSLWRFCLFEELALRIKELLISSHKKDPMCRIVMSFDRMSFDSLLIRATVVPKAGIFHSTYDTI